MKVSHDLTAIEAAEPAGTGATARRYATHLHDTLMSMVADPDESTRAALAGQFGEVCRLLGKERCQHYMKR